jgi:SAM-dependent methyltransferase
MHEGAMQFLQQSLQALPVWPARVLEIGSRDINGSPRLLFADDRVRYVGIDVTPGLGVDVVANGATFKSASPFDLVICAEVFEHTHEWPAILENMARLVTPDGIILVTAASLERAPHSAVDGGALQAGEWYGNLLESAVRADAERWWTQVHTEHHPSRGDVYLRASGVRF